MPEQPGTSQPDEENQNLRARLERAETTLGEILSGKADAMLIPGTDGAQLFTLKDANRSYRALIENMNEGALTLTPQGLVLYANQRLAGMLRTTLEKVIGSEIFHWFAPESREAIQALLQTETIENHHAELYLTAADGIRVPAYLSVSHLVLDEVDSICMVVTDLTEQKRNEAFLAKENLAHEIFEQAVDAIVICDGRGRVIRASKQAHVFRGKSPLGQLFDHAFPLHHLDGTAFSPIDSIDTEHNKSVEMILNHNGLEFNLLVSVGQLQGARDELLGSVVTLTDITKRKKAEDKLAMNEALLRQFIMHAPAAIAMLDMQMCYVQTSERWMQDYNIAGQDIIGKSHYAIFPEIGQHWKDIHQRVLAGAIESCDEDPFPRADGSIDWLQWEARPWYQSEKEIGGLIFFTQMITERKKAEASIEHLNRVLSVLSDINTLIVRVNDCEELFREACNIAVDQGGFRMAMIAIVEQSTMLPTAIISAGKDDKFQKSIKDIMSTSEGMQSSLVAQAIKEKRAVIANNTQIDHKLLIGKQYARAGVNSTLALPLLISGEAVGALVLYASEVDFFQGDEMKLLADLANDIAYAIDHIDKGDRLSYLAYYHVLTGLANRKLFLDRLTQHMLSATGSQRRLAVGMIDLERFRNVNDSLGRPAGDVLLKQVAEWLNQFTQDANLLAHIDADHFSFMVPDVRTDSNLARTIENLLAEFQKHSFFLSDSTFRIGIKIGIAVFPEDGDSADTLYANAEAALKKAKLSGNQYLFYEQKMTEAAADKLDLENQLRKAVENEEFELYYQPKVNLLSGKVTSAEALIRWNDPRTGLVAPGKFISTLEETGLIYKVGDWALRKAIEDNLRWREAGLPAIRISVNVSPLQLRNIHFIDEIKQLISLDEHAADGLELEITESLIMEDVRLSITTLKAIRAMGVTIAIDDFGTGYSSLNYLSKLPVDTLKIDRAFVDKMTDPEGIALASTIVALAHALKLKVVAEGVETEEQSRQLLSLNCDEMQGFLFSKPVPVDIFETRFLAPLVSGHEKAKK